MPDISLNCTRLDSNVIEIEFDDGLLHYRVNYRDGERRGLDVGVTPAILP